MTMKNVESDKFDLGRFIDAQNGIFESAIKELLTGNKRGHWMWFVFPQIAGLSTSSTARYFAISNQDEARAYLANPILRSRLEDAVGAAMSCGSRDVTAIFGYPDDLKFRSCLTLFTFVGGKESIFSNALAQFYNGRLESKTIDLLGVKCNL